MKAHVFFFFKRLFSVLPFLRYTPIYAHAYCAIKQRKVWLVAEAA